MSPRDPWGLRVNFYFGQMSERSPRDTGGQGGQKQWPHLGPITTAHCRLQVWRGDPNLLCFEIPTTTGRPQPRRGAQGVERKAQLQDGGQQRGAAAQSPLAFSLARDGVRVK